MAQPPLVLLQLLLGLAAGGMGEIPGPALRQQKGGEGTAVTATKAMPL